MKLPSRNLEAWATEHSGAVVLSLAATIFLLGILRPPSLMDDVDAAQAQIARNMLDSGDWVSARLNGVSYLEKAPLPYWMMALSFRTFGASDWAARLPLAAATILLCWVTARIGRWAFGEPAGLYSGLVISSCVGLFLFTRILIPDSSLTLTIALGLWAFLRALDEEEAHPRIWASLFAACLGAGLLFKGLIGMVIPLAAAFLYLTLTGQLFARPAWRRLRPFSGLILLLCIAAPWHILATLRNPPYFDLTMKSEAGHYHGFFWFYFLNEHLFRFLNMRYPRDYNTVPRAYFWLFQLLWLFPWSVYFPALFGLSYRPADRAGRVRLLALCWIGFVMAFFSFSTTQEYYSMPIYPALALLLGSAMVTSRSWLSAGTKLLAAMATACAVGIGAVLWWVRAIPTPGDIASALTRNPEVYTLSLGHLVDLTLNSFAYLRLPLAVAGTAFTLGAVALWRVKGPRAYLVTALMMAVFLQAARLALVVFNPFLSSEALAQALISAPPGQLVVDDQYYTFSSVFFYAHRSALLLNGRVNNLEYGSNAPGAPDVFLDDSGFRKLWHGARRCYLLVEGVNLDRFQRLVGADRLHPLRESGGKYLLTNVPQN